MAIWSVPVKFNSPDFNFQIDLDGTIYGFRFILNERTGRYSMSIATEAGDEIVSGIALVTNWAVIDRFADTRLPPGLLFTCDMTGGNNEPDEVNFGDSVLLCYDEANSA